jgi:hypothetical protein
MNHAQLRGMIARRLARTDPDITTVISEYINLAIKEICRIPDIMMFRREAPITLLPGTNSLDSFSVAGLVFVRRIADIDNNSNGRMIYLYHALTEEEGNLRNNSLNSSGTKACIFYLLGSTIYFIPAPTETQNLILEYQGGYPALVSDDDTNFLTEQFPQLVMYRTLTDLTQDYWSEKWAQTWLTLYTHYLDEFHTYDSEFSVTKSLLIPQVPITHWT